MDAAFRRAVARARDHNQLYFAGLLSEESILRAFGHASTLWKSTIYTPAVTVWVFLAQCLSPDHSCREAEAQLMTWLLARGRRACSPRTGAYCLARQRIPQDVGPRLVREIGRERHDAMPADWRWRGHAVVVVDGSTVTMPDTPANQAEYPQVSGQKPGCGFPIARFVVLFSPAVGTVLEAALSPYKGKQTGENSLFRTLHDRLRDGDVVLADRYFSGWFDLALLRARCLDPVRHSMHRGCGWPPGARVAPDRPALEDAPPAATA